MTVSLSALPGKLWQGLSSDTKPTQSTSNSVSAGDYFLATDTNTLYVYNVATGWTLWPVGSGGGGGGVVTNAGTFAVQNTAATPAGTNSIGSVTQATAANFNATVVGTGTFAVQNTAATPAGTNAIGTVTSVGNVASAATDSGNPVKTGGVYHSAAITLSDGQRGDSQLDVNGYLKVNVTNGITASSNASSALLIQDTPFTSGGLTYVSAVAPATVTKTAIKATAGQLYSVQGFNILATPVYVKLFNKTTANITQGTTDCDYQFMIPGNTAGAGFTLEFTKGIAFSTAISYYVSSAIGTHDNTNTTASSVIVNFGYA